MWKKLKKSNCDKTEELKLWQNWKTQIVTKLKKYRNWQLENSNCDKNKNLKLCQNSKTQTVIKLKTSNGDKTKKNSNSDKTQKLKLWQFKNSNGDKIKKKKKCDYILINPIVTKLKVKKVIILTYFCKKQLDTSTTDEMFSGQLFAILAMFFIHMQGPPHSPPP